MADHDVAVLLRQLIVATEAHTKAIDTISKRISSITQAPFGILIIGVSSWFFYIGKTSESYWLGSCAIAALPYYSEYVPMLFKLWNKTDTKK